MTRPVTVTAPEVRTLLARAYVDDPLMAWVFPEEEQRLHAADPDSLPTRVLERSHAAGVPVRLERSSRAQPRGHSARNHPPSSSR